MKVFLEHDLCARKGTLILAVGLRNVKVRQSTRPEASVLTSELVQIKQKRGHRVHIAPKLLELCHSPTISGRADQSSQFFKLVHRVSMRGGTHERKIGNWVARARDFAEPGGACCAPSPVFLSSLFSNTIRRMKEWVKLLAEGALDWIRDIVINVSGRLAEEFLGRRVKRRRARRRKPACRCDNGRKRSTSPTASEPMHDA